METNHNSLREHFINKEVIIVFFFVWLYPWIRPVVTQTNYNIINLLFTYVLIPVEFFTYYIPLNIGGSIAFFVFQYVFAITMVFLAKYTWTIVISQK